ncbi:MAG: YciI family protein [Pyrinomonadaceae bacterium]
MNFRTIRILLITVLFGVTGFGQAASETAAVAPLKYDAALANKLGGNDNGMKSYVLCILKTGPKDAAVQGKERDDIFAGHMANIGRLAEEGKLAVAGPFGKNDKNYRGLYVFNVTTVEEAQNLVMTDPAVKSGVLIADMTPWFASASLMATPEIHKRITKPKP